MNLEGLAKLFDRDMDRFHVEIEAINDADLWTISGDIKNSAGNLAIHLCGSLQHFIGNVLGNTGYQRDRVHEFMAKDLDKSYILSEIDTTKKMLLAVLPTISEKVMSEEFPVNVFGNSINTLTFLYHLYGHLNYHLGQINYRRRIIGEVMV